jgi:hypothetical protein
VNNENSKVLNTIFLICPIKATLEDVILHLLQLHFKEAFNRKISLLTSKINIELRKKCVRSYV